MLIVIAHAAIGALTRARSTARAANAASMSVGKCTKDPEFIHITLSPTW